MAERLGVDLVLTSTVEHATPSTPADHRRPAEHENPAAQEELTPATAVAPTILLALVTLGATASLSRVFHGSAWVGPAVATALAAHLTGWLGRRVRMPTGPAVAIGLVVVALVGIGTVVGSTTTVGLPLGRTWSAIHLALDQASHQVAGINPPVPPLVGFRLVVAWGVGLVAVLGDWAAFRIRAVLQAVAPAIALFVVACVLAGPSSRIVDLVALLVPLLAFCLLQRNTVGRAGTIWAGDQPRWPVPWKSGIAIATVGLLAAVVSLPTLAPEDGHGIFGWRHGSGGGGGGARSVISPIVDLQTRLLNEPDTQVMTVASPVPSYWRLTSLDTFTGVQWQSTNSYYPTGSHLRTVAPAPAGTRQVVERFELQRLDSIWLPAAFNPESVSGGGRVTWDPVSGSLLTAAPTADGLSYQVTSLQYLATLDTVALETAPAPVLRGALAADVALPSLDPRVAALARSITADKHTEYDKALALQNFFYGPSFHYSLTPPTDGYGSDALTNFLFDSRIGYCQQFAGSFAVLARSIGLPTRLAVGFTTGRQTAPGQYSVTDADAHTWPEVYFPHYGWLPFEPTKGNFSVPGSRGYTGDTANGSAVAAATSPNNPVTPAPHQVGGGTSTSTTAPAPATPAPTVGLTAAPSGTSAWWLIVPAGIVGLLAAWAASVAALRLRRGRRRRRLDPRSRVLATWGDAEALLAWRGVRRRRDETVGELAQRAATVLAAPLGDIPQLAGCAAEAGYGADPLAADLLIRAETALAHFAHVLRAGASWPRRLRWWADPRLAWPRS